MYSELKAVIAHLKTTYLLNSFLFQGSASVIFRDSGRNFETSQQAHELTGNQTSISLEIFHAIKVVHFIESMA